MKRQRILSDFERNVDVQGKTAYVYKGPTFVLDIPKSMERRFKVACWSTPLIALCLFVAMGLLNTDVTRQMYIAVPYVFLLLPPVMLLGDAYKVAVAGHAMRRAEYERGFAQMRRFTLGGVVLAAVVAAAVPLFWLISTSHTHPLDAAFCACAALTSALYCLFYRILRNVKVIQQDNVPKQTP